MSEYCIVYLEFPDLFLEINDYTELFQLIYKCVILFWLKL